MVRFVLTLRNQETEKVEQEITIDEKKDKKVWSKVNEIVEQWKNKYKKLNIKLDCSRNQLTSLPYNLPSGLTILDCSYNQLTSLPSNLPSGLTKLKCYNNRLTKLSDNLPSGLANLYCSNNQLTSLPDNLPSGLTKLYCYGNPLTSLPDNLPSGLNEIDCHHNLLTSLPDNLPSGLTILYCYNNQLTSLPNNLPAGLTILHCPNNQITSIPYSIIRCRKLLEINFTGNPIDYTSEHPAIMRFIKQIEQRRRTLQLSTVYTDSQSVHDTSIQESIRKSIDSIIKTSKLEDRKSFRMEEILKDEVLTEKTKRSLVEWCDDKTEHSLFILTFEELLVDVWGRVRGNDEIKRRLNEEMSDAECKCFTGRIGRLVNCLSGFYDDVEIKIKSSDQISSIIIQTRNKLGEKYTVEKHRELVKIELEEREYEKDIIEEWISNIE